MSIQEGSLALPSRARDEEKKQISAFLGHLKVESRAINTLALQMIPAGEAHAELYEAYARKRDMK